MYVLYKSISTQRIAMGLFMSQIWNLILALLLCKLTITDATPSLLMEEHDDILTYCLHFDKLGFSWQSAQEFCRSEKALVGEPPFPEFFMERLMEMLPSEANEIWLYGGADSPPYDCKTFKQDCEHVVSNALGSGLCRKYKWTPVIADCQANRRYLICTKEAAITTATSTTLKPTTRRVPEHTTPPLKYPKPATIPTDAIFPTEAYQPTKNPHKPSVKVDKPEDKNKHLRGFFLGLSVGKKDLLGLIIGVVTGSFLIIALIFVLCCACQGRSVKRTRRSYDDKDDLDYMERNSENSLLKSGHSGSNDSSNTLDHPFRVTEESSLELSDIPSHSSKPSHHLTSLDDDYPPPPIMYDHSPRVHRVSPARNYNNTGAHHLSPVPILKSPKPVFTVRADTRDSVLSDDLPLPPPPPPHQYPDSETEDETCVKGLSPKFKTFLDKTIAVQPQVAYPVKPPKPISRNYPTMALDESQQSNERTGLIRTDL